MITFDPVTPAPLATRIARVVLPLLLCFGYLAFRAYPAAEGRIPLGEAVVMGLVLMSLAMVTCIALGDLIYPATPRARRRASTEDLEITAVHAPIADADTVIATTYTAELARFDALIGDTQPYDLLTHEFHPEHHTPPGGFAILVDIPGVGHGVPVAHYAAERYIPPVVTGGTIRWPEGSVTELDAPTALHVLRGELYDAPDTGRHHRDED